MPHLTTFDNFTATPNIVGGGKGNGYRLKDVIITSFDNKDSTFQPSNQFASKEITHPEYEPEASEFESPHGTYLEGIRANPGGDGLRAHPGGMGFMKLDDIRGEFTTGGGGDSFNSWRDVRDHNYGKVINGPLYQPDALPDFSLTLHEQNPNSIHDKLIDIGTSIKQTSVADALTNYRPEGFSEVEIHFATENLDSRLINHDDFLLVNNVGSTSLQENCANGNWLNKGQQGEGFTINDGSIAQHWSMVNHDNMQGLDAGGMNYAEAVGLDSFTVDVVNKVTGSASPGGDDV